MNADTAFLELLTRHAGILHKVGRMYTDTAADREDLVQEIAYQLWKSYPSFRGESKASTWIYRVALNTALGRLRVRRLPIRFGGDLPDVALEASVDEDNVMDLLFTAIRRLPRADRALIALYLEDLSHQEIGAVLGITPNHVGVKLHRTKSKLKSLLNT